MSSIGLTTFPDMSENYQKASITLAQNTANESYYALPANCIYNLVDPNGGYPETKSLDFTSGVKVLEFEINLPEQLFDEDNNNFNDGSYKISGNFFPPSNVGELKGRILIVSNSGQYSLSILWGTALVFSNFFSYHQLPKKIGFEFNANNSSFKVYFDGINQTLLNNSFTPEKLAIGFLLGQEALSSPNAGRVASIRLITLAQDMTTSFSLGTTDPFGNTTNNQREPDPND